MIFDTHAHYDDSAFDPDRAALLSALPQAGVCRIVNQGTNLQTSEQSIQLAEKYSYIYAAVGIHPECLEDLPDGYIDCIRSLASHPKVVAIGEIGLDYHYDIPRDRQQAVFEQQLELARDLDMPVTVHDREAHGDTLDLLMKYRPRGIVHCFSGSVEMALEVVKLGMYIGVGGVATFKTAKKLKDVVREVPPERIVLETDAPYLAPVPFRGKRCDSSMISRTALALADILGRSPDDILKTTCRNAYEVYGMTDGGKL